MTELSSDGTGISNPLMIEFRLLKNIRYINYNKFECSFSKGSEGACL